MKLTDDQCRVIEMLISLARTAHHALDNSEERAGKDRTEFVLTDPWYRELSDALDALDALSDDKPGCTLGAAGKAEWALRELLAASTPTKAEAKCRACNGNDSDMPCAYPEGRADCLRNASASTLGETVQGKPMATTAEFDVAIETLRHVIECLRNTGRYTDEEGEATDFLEPLLYAHQHAGEEIAKFRITQRQHKVIDALLSKADALIVSYTNVSGNHHGQLDSAIEMVRNARALLSKGE